jgi:hypothetical protein
MTYTLTLKQSFNTIFIVTLLTLMGWMGTIPNNCHASNVKGIYNGTFHGEQNGTWFLLIDDSKKGQIYFWVTANQVVDSGNIQFNSGTNFNFTCTYGISGSGSINPNGKISGNWKFNEISGNLTGSRQDLSKIKTLVGTYSSNCSGNETGSWNFTVSAKGSITGTVTWDKNGLAEEGNGIINSKGDFIFLTKDDTSAQGALSPSGEISGNWNNPFWETSGTFGNTPHLINSSKKTATTENKKLPVHVESDDQNGCFIQAVVPF